LSLTKGSLLLLRAVKSAIARDISSGDGVDLMVITDRESEEKSPGFA